MSKQNNKRCGGKRAENSKFRGNNENACSEGDNTEL